MKKKEPILVYRAGRISNQKVRRHFIQWRQNQNPPISMRCDNPICCFHTQPCVWNGSELKLILDHKNGVCGDNRPKNLQFLCPNCNSQQPTHGGANKGKVEQSSGGFSIKDASGKKHYVLPVETAEFKLTGSNVNMSITKKLRTT